MKLLLTIILTFVFASSGAQIEISDSPKKVTVGKVTYFKNFVAELYYKVVDGDTAYCIYYRNAEYTRIDDYKILCFLPAGNTVDKLYTLMKSVFLDENKKNKEYKVDIKLGSEEVSIKNIRAMGSNAVILSTNEGFFSLTEKQLDKLFGK